jgi:cell division protein ZapA
MRPVAAPAGVGERQMDGTRGRVVSVEIGGQRYPIRSELEPDYVVRLAAYVDERVRAAAEQTPSADWVRIVVLAALNIADEYFQCREATLAESGRVRARAEALERLVDQALAGAAASADPAAP